MSGWTKERVEITTRMWAEGATASQIAVRFGISRSAVMGYIQRHKLVQGKRPEGYVRPTVRRAVSAPPKPDRPAAAAPRASTGHIVRTCQWPHGDPRKPGFHFCGAEPATGRPYCRAHMEIAYQQRAPKGEPQDGEAA